MAKHPMPQEKQDQIRALVASGKTFTEVGAIMGMSRQSVAKTIHPEQKEKQRIRELKYGIKRRAMKFIRLDAEDLPEGCFNVNEKENWISGFGA